MTIQKLTWITAIAITLAMAAQLVFDPLNFGEIRKLERMIQFLKESLSP